MQSPCRYVLPQQNRDPRRHHRLWDQPSHVADHGLWSASVAGVGQVVRVPAQLEACVVSKLGQARTIVGDEEGRRHFSALYIFDECPGRPRRRPVQVEGKVKRHGFGSRRGIAGPSVGQLKQVLKRSWPDPRAQARGTHISARARYCAGHSSTQVPPTSAPSFPRMLWSVTRFPLSSLKS